MLKNFKPVTPSQRQYINLQRDKLSKKIFFPRLKKGFNRSFGKNNQGKITSKYRGGGHKKLYRIINFKQQQNNGTVRSIEYDPNRSAFIAAIENISTKTNSYIIATDGLKIGDFIMSGETAPIQLGNSLPLQSIPIGSLIHNISLASNKKAQLIRSAGVFAQLIQKNSNGFGKIRLSSGQYKTLPLKAYATIGLVSNINHKNKNYGKAGRMRWLNRRPRVRGVAMNPVDHPHGGGEGKTSGGRPSVSFSGKLTKGKPTVLKKKY